LAEGTAIKDLLNPDRILIGSSQTPHGLAAASALKAVYTAWVAPEKILSTNLWSSELAKLVANAMLAQRISSINTVSAICERTGADVDEVAAVIGQDQRLGSKFLKSGVGFGGSCFTKDILNLVYLANSLELPEVGDYWMQVLKINEWQRVRFVKKIIQRLNHTLSGKKITILGYAFKKDTNDTRESPAIEVVRQLLADAPQQIAIFDPQCTPTQITNELERQCGSEALQSHGGPVAAYQDAYSACDKAAAIIVLTDWDQFRYPSLPIPQSAFHDGHRLIQDPFARLREAISEKEVLAIRERRSHNTFLDRKTSYFDPLERFEPEPKCLPGCSECSEGRRKDYLSHAPIDWAVIAAQSRPPRWVFDGRGILDVAGMKKLGFRVERVGCSSSSHLW
jgi:UDPglucose 6-dehydrogenase